MIGQQLSHYRIESELGRGGMGVVYRATDTKLNRTVALKVLPAAALASPDDRARFVREAQSAAQLHHPNIATVFGIDEAVPEGEGAGTETRLFIAMEYIEGETLREYVQKGPVKLDKAVSIASQIAEALKDAHAKDIVHRDIKSANIMLTNDGVAKVLDFGLAKTNASTMLTRMGSTLGTVAYMSPEQARGEEVDGRSDLYSLGTVLYEMIAGVLPFPGDYEQAVLYGIMNEDAEPLTAIRTGVPMELERIVLKLLAKDVGVRHQSAAGLLADLKGLDLSAPHSAVSRPVAAAVTARSSPLRAVATLATTALAAAALAWILKPAPPSPSVRFPISLPFMTPTLYADWSPDGRQIYYVAQDSSGAERYVRVYDLETGSSVRVPGTGQSDFVYVSPDGRWLYLHDSEDLGFKRLLLGSEEPSPVPGTSTVWGFGRMLADGEFVYTSNALDLMGIAQDGSVRTVMARDSLASGGFAWPQSGPDGKGMFWSEWVTSARSAGTWGVTANNPIPRKVLSDYTLILLSRNGWGLFSPTGVIGPPAVIAPFDSRTGEFAGSPVPFVSMVPQGSSLSPRGHLLFQQPASSTELDGEPMLLISRDGSEATYPSVPGVPNRFAVANTQLAVAVETRTGERGERRDIWVHNLETGSQTRLTRDGDNDNPTWSPDDNYVYFDRRFEGHHVVVRKRADGIGSIELVLDDGGVSNPAISSDGTTMVFDRWDGEGWDLHSRDIADGREWVLAEGEGSQTEGEISPNGRFVAFNSRLTPDEGIVVSAVDAAWSLALTSSGSDPIWSPDGRYIYYIRDRKDILRILVQTEPSFSVVGSEEMVYSHPSHVHFDLTPQGELLIAAPVTDMVSPDNGQAWVVLNFADEMKRLAPRY